MRRLFLSAFFVAVTLFMAFAGLVENRGVYATNPQNAVGQEATITIDGDPSDWNTSMLIAQGSANDMCTAFKGSHENCVLDCYALYATIAEKVKNGEDVTAYLSDTKCGDALFDHELDRYMLLSISATVVDVFAAFEQNKNLIAVIITESGQMGEKALTMVTPADFPRINKYLETYGKLSEYKESIIQ